MGPAFDQFSEPAQGVREFVGNGGEAEAEMRRRIEAVSRREQDAPFRCRLTEGAAILSAREPWKRGHPSTRRNPADRLLMLGHKTAEVAKIFTGYFLRSAEHSIAVAHGKLRQKFAGGIVGDGKISARIPVVLLALWIVLDHPSGPDT